MEIEVLARPGAAAARVTLAAGETFTAEVGAMIAMTTGIDLETTTRKKGGRGGLLRAARRVLAGENLFLNHFTARADGQSIVLGPRLIGDIVHHRLVGGSVIAEGNGWLGSSEGIEVDASWQGFTSALFSGESIFWVKCEGEGELLLSSFGAIYEIDVDGTYTVDTGHVVAFEDTLSFRVGKAARSLIGSFLGGEGFVCKFEGRGKLYCQTHNPRSFGDSLGSKLRRR